MTKEEFERLIDKYLAGVASEREEQIVEEFFLVQERKATTEDRETGEEVWTSIEKHIGEDLEEDHLAVRGTSRRYWWMAGVAVVILIVAAGFFSMSALSGDDPEATPWITIDAPFGQKSLVTLPDGTRIFLNGGSFVKYPEVFAQEKREVSLSGEAFFEVAPNPHQPFIVTSGDVVTQVLGTSFNVQAFPEKEVSVTVATGKVQVNVGLPAARMNATPGPNAVILTPNDQAIYVPGQSGFSIREVDIEKYLAWKDNTLLFKDTSLEQVADILARWYNVSITFDNEQIKRCHINGKYKDQSLESVLQSIQYMYHIDYEFQFPNRVRLKGDGCKSKMSDSS